MTVKLLEGFIFMKKLTLPLQTLALMNMILLATACGKSSSDSSTEDSSTSGTVASAVGGAANGSSGGTLAFLSIDHKSESKMAAVLDLLYPMHAANASVSCPTIASGGSSCAVSGTTESLTYASCSFGCSAAVWNGSQIVNFSGATPTCGSAFPTGMSSVTRTFGSGTTRTSASGVEVAVDSAGSYQAVDGNTYSGGELVSFSGGVRSGITINGLNIWSPVFHHSLTTNAGVGGSPIVISGGNTITSGAVITFHNLARVKASSSFANVGFSTGCCTPTSGTITTSFSTINGVTPTALGTRLAGTSESLTFTGCGTATYSGIDGTAGAVTLGHCF
jgi:hypothetical protein